MFIYICGYNRYSLNSELAKLVELSLFYIYKVNGNNITIEKCLFIYICEYNDYLLNSESAKLVALTLFYIYKINENNAKVVF